MEGLTGAEQGFLLLTSHLGVPDRKVLTVAQFRKLAERVTASRRGAPMRELETEDLITLGYGPDTALHYRSLLQEEELLRYYVAKGRKAGCVPVTRASPTYPLRVRKALGQDAPGCLWARGDLALLDAPAVALVGSRELREPNREFAREVGAQAAKQGYTLVSGNARGADKTAQQACLAAGGSVISVVADSLESHRQKERVLYLSEDSFDFPFSAQRALSRNRVIHSMCKKTFVAQATLRMGGTWDGTVKNLRQGWSEVFCFRDGSEAAKELEQLGAALIDIRELENIDRLEASALSVFTME